ncbi:glycyl-radical enzyme activating protein [Clostridia bacterium]|nr:glycyl-radical enzyme activating protein [Clostridia bacterium]
MKEALIFDIQRFSLHDGPGIRTLIFFKGCSLSCAWCSNPEGICPEAEIRQKPLLCTGCGKCLQNCPFGAISARSGGMAIDREKCQRCGACTEHCATQALSWWGNEYSVGQLFRLVQRDAPFYASSGGGVTLGGGDPLLQNEPAVALLERCHENGLNTAIETAGNYPWEYLENAAPYCDTIHMDVKGWRKDVCRKCIGADNTRILDNLRRLDEWIRLSPRKPRLIVRTPLIPGCNFTQEDYEALAAFLSGLKSLTAVEILPFHNLGETKYSQLGKAYSLKGRNNLKAEAAAEYKEIMLEKNVPVTVTTM